MTNKIVYKVKAELFASKTFFNTPVPFPDPLHIQAVLAFASNLFLLTVD